ncbi:MAG TPA: glycerol kinase [Elusimicrobia bacterium]|nr:MAG: glycerol kinase [Elusimicrobia bacterium RIFOXYA12_FULL_49_49]OGS06615.1 MAG: glycerol kinase [Elusimicrobia bacterium RIFOXYA1_FULL_47_7]OGS15115.1 MAG: glycerol kinase [Elusimicrobia bacterium RIFOXYA2_FULL_47_53]OGS29735.1 MAG: glycerol kinase [Elusimicrobia bacterium RIFOXYB2_FULL_46_23]HBU70213.1 glycerol kinase [Elusimicrobiota bacterium]
MNEKVVVALDLGTTGNRAIAFNKRGETVAKSYYEFPQYFPEPGWVEHDPLELYGTALKALKDVVAEAGAQNISSIGITNQRETTVIWDKKTGKPIYNAIVWQCRRTEKICAELKKYSGIFKEKTGLFLDPYFSGTKIKWILDNVEGAREKARRGELLFGTPDTWVLWNLTAGKTHATEPSNASRTLIYNINSLSFDKELLEILSIPAGILPQVKDSDAFFGLTDKSVTGLEIPVRGMLGDQQASLFAHNGWEKGTAKATYGTGIFMLTNTGDKLVSSPSLVSTIASKTAEGVSYALEGSIFSGGAAVQWLRDNIEIIGSGAETEKMACSLEGNDNIYFVPAFQGLGAPYWDSNARGLLIGITRKTSKENIARAVIESMAYQVKDVADEMKKAFGAELAKLRVDGGACANNFLMQFQSDLLGFPVERPRIIETTALGAAGISAIASGFWSREEFQKVMSVERIFRPAMNPEKAASLYAQWQKAVERSRSWA